MEALICYCFNYTASDIEQDILANRKSTIMEKILSEKKAGRCQCATKNPKGRWCLADVRQVVDETIKRYMISLKGSLPNDEKLMTRDDLKKIEIGIRQKYFEVAKSPEGKFQYPTGRKGLEALNYDKTLTDKLPDDVASSYCGVGNPFSLGKINEGAQVLDVGCGAGVDTILAGMMVGANGSVVGVDMVPEMIARAESNLKITGIGNVSFQNIAAESLPFPDDTFDVAISNGVINLIPDKEAALAEVHRVLKPGGRLMVADQIAVGNVQKDIRAQLASWFQWEGGAIPGMDFLAMLKKAGFSDTHMVAETGFNSSPKTKGTLFRAFKAARAVEKNSKAGGDFLRKF